MKFGWHPSTPDARDLQLPPIDGITGKRVVSLRDQMPPIWNQGELESCVAHSVPRIVLHRLVLEGHAQLTDTPSRLFTYYQARALERTGKSDCGTTVRSALKVAAVGLPPELDWAYDVSKFAVTPPPRAYTDAPKDKALRYYTMSNTRFNLKWCIDNDYPVAFGIALYASFESSEVTSTGIVPEPKPDEKMIGGHSMTLIGYDDDRQLYEADNSYGPGFGDDGRVWLPYSYVEGSNAADFWTVRLES